MTTPKSASPIVAENNHLSICSFCGITTDPLCNSVALCVSVVNYLTKAFTTEAQRSHRDSQRKDLQKLSANLDTSSLNTLPRCSKLSNMSKLAHAGASKTTSPGFAAAKARATP